MESIYIEERQVKGLGEVQFLPIPMIELSPLYREVLAVVIETSIKLNGLDSEIHDIAKLIADKRFAEMRNAMFKFMIVDKVNLLKGFEKIFTEKGILLEIPLFMAGVEVYLGKLLSQALESDSDFRKAVVDLFPQVESILTGFSGSQLLEKLQALQK